MIAVVDENNEEVKGDWREKSEGTTEMNDLAMRTTDR